MAKRDASFVDKHIEKVALGVCALAFLGAAWFSFLGDRFTVDEMRPDQLCEKIAEEAQQTASAVRNARLRKDTSKKVDPKKDPVVQLRRWFGSNAEKLIKIAKVESPVGRTQPFPPEFISTTQTPIEDRHNLARIVAPGIPLATSGRSGFDFPEEKPDLGEYTGQPPRGSGQVKVVNWVAVAAQIDLNQQEVNFISEGYPEGSFPFITNVHLQRIDLTDSWRGWQNVETYLPFKPIKRPVILTSTGQLSLGGLAAFRSLIESKQEYISRPHLPPKKSGDRVGYPKIPYLEKPPSKDDPRSRMAKNWLRDAEKAMNGKRPFKSVDLDTAFVLLRAVVGTTGAKQRDLIKAEAKLKQVVKQLRRKRPFIKNLERRRPDQLMPVMAHDLDVVPGHEYAYRMRYEVYNVFCGDRGEMKNPADAEKLTIFSDWSPLSRPVKIESDIYLYLTDKNPKKQEVTVTVYKKARGGWKKQDFKVRVGDEIGRKVPLGRNKGVDFRTNAICVDIDFKRRVRGKSDVSMAYVIAGEGDLRERILTSDKNDKFRRGLTNRTTARK